jgi:hypothetical protein
MLGTGVEATGVSATLNLGGEAGESNPPAVRMFPD